MNHLETLYPSILEAENTIRRYIRTTFLDYSYALSKQTGVHVYLKHEAQQHTGSFKVRGAFNRLLSLTSEEAQQGVICASAGNHGCAVAYVAQCLNIQATVFLPETTSSLKMDKITSYGATIKRVKGDCLQAELLARQEAELKQCVYVSPYNDPFVIAGQGTLGIELQAQCPEMDAVFISVGGGGLIAGVGAYLKSVNSAVEMVGVWPEHAPTLSHCIQANKIIEVIEKPTYSESTAGGLEQGSITFEPCKSIIDTHILVSETEIASAMKLIAETETTLIEGAAGVAVAGFLQKAKTYQGKHVVIVLCGKNIPYAQFKEITT
ncbi:MAG: threonine/serine dehydratase [Vampirovibrionales bacterium]